MLETLVLDALDAKANDAFPGLVVRKDLLRRLRSAFGVPTFVIEFLLGKYCASPDPTVIEQGLEFVRASLADKYVKPDEREVVKARIQQHGEYTIIDRVSATLKEVDDKYWATLHNINPLLRTNGFVAGLRRPRTKWVCSRAQAASRGVRVTS